MRAKDAAGAALVAVAAPVAVAFFAAPNQDAREHIPPPSTTLEVALTSSPLFGDSDHTIKLLAPGRLTEPVELSDSSGRNRARITGIDRCSGARVVDTQLPGGKAEVCIRITGLHAGSVTSGTLAFGERGTDGTVDASFRARHHFALGPMLVALLGIAGSLALASGRRVLFQANEEAALHEMAARATIPIDGLTAWIARSRSLEVAYATRYAVVGKLAENGGEWAAKKRSALGAVIAKVTGRVPEGHPVLIAASREQARQDHRVEDFVDDAGVDLVHPAQLSAGDLLALDALYGRLIALHQLAPRLGPNPPATPLNRLRFAEQRLLATSSPVVAAALDAAVVSAEEAFLDAGIDLYTGTPAPKAGPPAPKIPDLEEDLGVYLAGYRQALRWVNVLVAVGIIALALVSVAFAVWMPSTLFGTSADYYTVLTAAVASGAGAGLVALWGSWRGDPGPAS